MIRIDINSFDNTLKKCDPVEITETDHYVSGPVVRQPGKKEPVTAPENLNLETNWTTVKYLRG